jgi:predicted metal-dependent hydrolase
MEQEEAHNTINLKQAIDNLTLMFPNIDKQTMIEFLKENNGQLEQTIEQLLIINETTSNPVENDADLLDFNKSKYDTKLESDVNADNLNENNNINENNNKSPSKNEDILDLFSSSPKMNTNVNNETSPYTLEKSVN